VTESQDSVYSKKNSLGIGCLIIAVPLIVICLFLMHPKVRGAREAARRSMCKNNLKNIGIALHQYHGVYDCFPPAYIADNKGQPLYSWRVLLLPYLDQEKLYQQFNLDEPWDSPQNKELLEKIPTVFRCPTHGAVSENDSEICTHYSAVFGEGCIFEGANSISIQDITDGTSQTVAVLEVSDAVIPWSAPVDIHRTKHLKLGDRNGYSSDHQGGLHALFADGSIHFLNTTYKKLDTEMTRQLMLRNDGEKIEDF